jgi:hypothetical protein
VSIDANYQRSFRINGLVFNSTQTVSSDVGPPWSVTLAVAKVGTLSVRTSASVGTLTMASSHGITDGNRLDLYWTGGSRRGIVVGTVAVNSVPITGGTGDDLPDAATSITAQVPNEESLVVTGDDVVSIAASCANGGTIVFADASDVELFAISLTTTITSYVWTSADGGTNPLAGDAVAKIFLSQPSSAATGLSYGAVQYD